MGTRDLMRKAKDRVYSRIPVNLRAIFYELRLVRFWLIIQIFVPLLVTTFYVVFSKKPVDAASIAGFIVTCLAYYIAGKVLFVTDQNRRVFFFLANGQTFALMIRDVIVDLETQLLSGVFESYHRSAGFDNLEYVINYVRQYLAPADRRRIHEGMILLKGLHREDDIPGRDLLQVYGLAQDLSDIIKKYNDIYYGVLHDAELT